MEKSIILCPRCRRIVAIGAALPAVCLAAIPDADRDRLSAAELDRHPDAHHDCIEVFAEVPGELDGQALLDAVTATHGPAFAAVVAGGTPPAVPPPLPMPAVAVPKPVPPPLPKGP